MNFILEDYFVSLKLVSDKKAQFVEGYDVAVCDGVPVAEHGET